MEVERKEQKRLEEERKQFGDKVKKMVREEMNEVLVNREIIREGSKEAKWTLWCSDIGEEL